MRARRDDRSDDVALFHQGVEIGSVRGETVGFAGFTTRADAALAASLAHHALQRRRARDAYRHAGSSSTTAVRVLGYEGAGGESGGRSRSTSPATRSRTFSPRREPTAMA